MTLLAEMTLPLDEGLKRMMDKAFEGDTPSKIGLIEHISGFAQVYVQATMANAMDANHGAFNALMPAVLDLGGKHHFDLPEISLPLAKSYAGTFAYLIADHLNGIRSLILEYDGVRPENEDN